MIHPLPEWVAGELYYGGLCLGVLALSYAAGYAADRLDDRTEGGDWR